MQGQLSFIINKEIQYVPYLGCIKYYLAIPPDQYSCSD